MTSPNIDKEIWKTIKDFPNYEVSNYGMIRKDNGKILDPTKNKCHSGGYKIYLTHQGRSRSRSIQRLVAEEFELDNPDPEKFMIVGHNDGNKSNNHISNLEWVRYRNQFSVKKESIAIKRPLKLTFIKHRLPIFNENDFKIINKVKKLIPEKQKLLNDYETKIKNETKEIWRSIPDFSNYQASNFGKIRNKTTCEILSMNYRSCLYINVYIKDNNNQKKSKQVHVLIASAFIPNPYQKPVVNHIDGNKHNAKLSNLEWTTFKENSQHAVESGLHKTHTKGAPLEIIMTDLNDKHLRVFPSIKAAGKAMKLDVRRIQNNLKGVTTNTDGYKWLLKHHHDDEINKYPGEIWKIITNFPAYSVSDYGRVKINSKNQIRKPYERFGYKTIALTKNKKKITNKVSRLVATAFIDNDDNLPIVDHINTIRNDDRVSNLRWVDQTGNMNNKTTRKKYHKKVAQCKLGTTDIIKEFSSLTQAAKESQNTIGRLSEVCNNNKRKLSGKGVRLNAGGYNWKFIE